MDKIKKILAANDEFMDMLQLLGRAIPEPWYVFGGQVINLVWDELNGQPGKHASSDVDIAIYSRNSSTKALYYEKKLTKTYPKYLWDVQNYAFSYIDNDDDPYGSLSEGFEKQLMTLYSIGVTINEKGALSIMAPYGVEDMLNFVVRPTPIIFEYSERIKLIHEKVKVKKWAVKWPNLRIET